MTPGFRTSDSKERVDSSVTRLARRQYGLISRAQATRLGVSSSSIHRHLASGRWERQQAGVYRLVGVPSSWQQRVLAACLTLGEDSVASRRTAAQVWGLTRSNSVVEVSVPTARRRKLPGVVIYRTCDFAAADRTVHDGIPVTTPARTLIDLAAIVPAKALEEVLDDALARGLVSVPHLQQRLRVLARRGRAGIATIRSLIDERAPGRGPESRLETRLLQRIRGAGLPLPIRQYEVRDRGRLVARVDFAYPDLKLAIEADGYGPHAGRARFDRDRARLNVLTLLGWRVILVTWTQLRDDPDAVVAQIARALSQRATPFAPR